MIANTLLTRFFLPLFCIIGLASTSSAWQHWWSHEMSINGPDFWALNPAWRLCKYGRHQSPISIQPRTLLYDPNLPELRVNSTKPGSTDDIITTVRMKIGNNHDLFYLPTAKVKGLMSNTGNDLTIDFHDLGDPTMTVNITSGPLSYHYRMTQIKLHFGSNRSSGSEHRVGTKPFPGEIQMYGYNADLYNNLTEARSKSQGVVAIAVFLEVDGNPNKELDAIFRGIPRIRYKGNRINVSLSAKKLLPDTTGYITYDGSFTYPGCQETVTWIIMNRPVYITRNQWSRFGLLYRDSEDSLADPMADNFRPVMPLNRRPVRTNINFPKATRRCNMKRDVQYKCEHSSINIHFQS